MDALRAAIALRRAASPGLGGGSREPADARPADGGAGGGPERGVHPRGPADRPVEPGAEAVPAAEMAGGAGRRDGGDPDPGGDGGRGGRAGESREGGRDGEAGRRPLRLAEIGLRLPAVRVPALLRGSAAALLLRARAVRPEGRGPGHRAKPCRFPTITCRARRRARRQAVGEDGGDVPSSRRPGRQGLPAEDGPPLRGGEDARGGEDPPAEPVRHDRRGRAPTSPSAR